MLFAVSSSITFKTILAVLTLALLSACVYPPVSHIERGRGDSIVTGQTSLVEDRTSIPDITSSVIVLPKPSHQIDRALPSDVEEVHAIDELYSVVVRDVPASDVLQALSNESAVAIDVIGNIDGELTLSVVDQPLESILDKISTLVPMHFEKQLGGFTVMSDEPVLRSYEIDYLNLQRSSESRVDLATQVGSMRTSVDSDSGGQSGSNGSRLFVENKSENRFWESLVESISGILGEVIVGGVNSASNLFVNRESGIISVRARESQHKAIAALVAELVDSAHRQVLIEATVVEVALNDSFESGVDWKLLAGSSDNTLDYAQIFPGSVQAANAVAPVNALLTLNNINSSLGNVSATLKLLQQFGEVQVLSSPRIIAMNNQPAVLKVVDNRVYFTFEVDRMQKENGDESTVVDTTVHSVPVGLVMNVTPFINKHSEVILNVRPTISRILNFAEDPSPALAGQSEIRNLIPEIQVREMESLLRVPSGKVAVIGGLMQNKTDWRNTGVPGLKRVPLIGKIFSHDTRTVEKTELLVFLKPTVVGNSSNNNSLLRQ